MSGGVLTGSEITAAVVEGDIEITPFEPKHLNPASIDLTLGPYVLMYNGQDKDRDFSESYGRPLKYETNRYVPLDCRKKMCTDRLRLHEDGEWLYPGHLYLMHTNERIKTLKYSPHLDGKSSIGRLGIVIHLTAGYGDPGFDGQYTLEVTVVHQTKVYPGMRFCQMRFHTLVGAVEDYSARGHYTGKLAEGPVPSMTYKQFEKSGVE